uniref:Uncharacterized protein n=1 Tax=Megaselia scalaris TaxID=36166 RepID=T1GSY7_MEGSC
MFPSPQNLSANRLYRIHKNGQNNFQVGRKLKLYESAKFLGVFSTPSLNWKPHKQLYMPVEAVLGKHGLQLGQYSCMGL